MSVDIGEWRNLTHSFSQLGDECARRVGDKLLIRFNSQFKSTMAGKVQALFIKCG